MRQNKFAHPLLYLAVSGLFLSAACSGGDGGSAASVSATDGSSDTVSVTPLPLIGSPSTFETEEFRYAGGLDQINAQHAYARGATGQGVTVAVIDTGVNFKHPDLGPNRHSDSTNIRTGGAIHDLHGHGTAVAGIAGAVKNDIGMHGVAFDSRILGVRADNCDSVAPPGCEPAFVDTDVAAAMNYAISHGAKVINLSLGAPGGESSALRNALINAANAGVMVFAATGNASASQPDLPASLATDPSAGRTLVAMGAVDSASQRASFSNACGTTAQSCVVAPGVNIRTTDFDGNGYAFLSGTSAATPHGSGAAAVLLSAFPNLSAAQVIDILLSTASDLGASGTDSIFGRGLINLQAAMEPSGPLSVPLSEESGGQSASAEDSTISLGPAFGDSMVRHSTALETVVALDAYDRAYGINLSNRVVAARRHLEWDGAIAAEDRRTINVPGPLGIRVGFSVRDVARAREESGRTFAKESYRSVAVPGVEGISVEGSLGSDTAFTFSANLTAASIEDGAAGIDTPGRLFLYAHESLAPYVGMFGSGTGFAVTHRLSEQTSLHLGWFGGEAPGPEDYGPSDHRHESASLAHAVITRELGPGAALGVRFSSVDENGTFLASRSNGAFGDHVGARSQYLSADLSLPLSGKIDLFGSYTEAFADIDDGHNSLLTDWSAVRANSFAVGITSDDVFAAGDRIGLMAAQPLRVRSARATLNVPESANIDGSINFASHRVDVTPTGREIDLQLAYERAIAGRIWLQGWIIGRFEPGHERDADADFGAGFKFRAEF